MKFLDPRTGWKTYAICAIGIIAGILQAFGIHIPGWVDWCLVFMGGAALRHTLQKQSDALASTVRDAITLPPTAPVIPVDTASLPPIK